MREIVGRGRVAVLVVAAVFVVGVGAAQAATVTYRLCGVIAFGNIIAASGSLAFLRGASWSNGLESNATRPLTLTF